MYRKGYTCSGRYSQSSDILVDDLLIFASITDIDGVGGTLGRAGGCRFT